MSLLVQGFKLHWGILTEYYELKSLPDHHTMERD